MRYLNIQTLLTLFLVIGLAACSSDDDSGPALNVEEVLPGTWEPVALSVSAEGTIEGEFNGTITFVHEGRDFLGEITFMEDPREFISDLAYTLLTTVEIALDDEPEETDNYNEVVNREEITGNWSINENGQLVGLHINVPGREDEAWKYDVEIISSNQIFLRAEEQFIDMEQGSTSVTDTEIEIELSRVN